MGIDFYTYLPSGPARMVQLLAKHLDVPLDVNTVDLMKQEQMKPEFVAINPQHTVPTMVDDGFVLTESRAMLMYLQNKYGKDESLYPKDPQKRALVDMRLFFDISTLQLRFGEAHYPVMAKKEDPDPAKMQKISEALGYVELFLKDGYIAGNKLTIADFSVAVILNTIAACDFDMSKFPKVTGYLEKCKSTMKGFDEIVQPGSDMIGRWYKGALAALDA